MGGDSQQRVITEDDRQRADIRRQIAEAMRSSDPNAERLRNATDVMQAVTLEDMRTAAAAATDRRSREQRMGAAIDELKGMMSAVRSKRADIPGGTTASANITVAPIVPPGQAAPPPFEAKTRILGSVQPFSASEFDLVLDRFLEGTTIRKVLNPDSSYNKKAIGAIAVTTLNISDSASPGAGKKLLAVLESQWRAMCEYNSEVIEEFELAFDLLGEPGAGQKIRVKMFHRSENADPFVGMAKDLCEKLLGSDEHPAINESRKALTEINYSVELGDDLNELLQSDQAVLSVLNKVRVHVEGTFPHAYKQYMYDVALAAIADRLGSGNFSKDDAEPLAQVIAVAAGVALSARHEVNVTANSIESAVASVVRFLAPAWRKHHYEEREDADIARLLVLGNYEEMVARVMTRQFLAGVTGLKLRNFGWFTLAALRKKHQPLVDPIVFTAAEAVESIDSVQLYGRVLMTDMRVEGLRLADLAPRTRDEATDFAYQLQIANKLAERELQKAVSRGEDGDGDAAAAAAAADLSDMDEDDVLERDSYSTLAGKLGRRDEALVEVEKLFFEDITQNYAEDVTNAEKNCVSIVQDVAVRTSSALVALLGPAKLTQKFTFNWNSNERPPPPPIPALDADGGSDNSGAGGDEEEVKKSRFNVVIHRGRHIEIAQTSDAKYFAATAAGAAVMVVVVDAATLGDAEPAAEELKEEFESVRKKAGGDSEGDEEEEMRRYKFLAPGPIAALLKPYAGKALIVTTNAATAPSRDEVVAKFWADGLSSEAPQLLHVADPASVESAVEVLERVNELIDAHNGALGKKSSAPWDFY